MRPRLPLVLLALLCASPGAAAEMPKRKAGLWEIQMNFNPNVPERTMQQCTDAATDQQLFANAGNVSRERQCSKNEVQTSGNTVVVDSTCTVNGRTMTTHNVITGSFDSAYTMNITMSGGPDTPGAPKAMTMQAKWLGPCKADQRPGDMIMPGGVKINAIEMRNRAAPK